MEGGHPTAAPAAISLDITASIAYNWEVVTVARSFSAGFTLPAGSTGLVPVLTRGSCKIAGRLRFVANFARLGRLRSAAGLRRLAFLTRRQDWDTGNLVRSGFTGADFRLEVIAGLSGGRTVSCSTADGLSLAKTSAGLSGLPGLSRGGAFRLVALVVAFPLAAVRAAGFRLVARAIGSIAALLYSSAPSFPRFFFGFRVFIFFSFCISCT